MKRALLSLALLLAGCRSPLTFSCNTDAQCDVKCVAHACVVPSIACPSGYSYDKSAGALAGRCVQALPADGADMAHAADLAEPPVIDMAVPIVIDMATTLPDLALTCAHAGDPCTVGVGACEATGKIVCNGTTANCDAVAGIPDNGWHTSPAANGSWDWNCDGQVWFQLPSGDSTKPVYDTAYPTPCNGWAAKALCEAPQWYYVYYNHWQVSCGHPVTDQACYWATDGSGCQYLSLQDSTQGCK